MGWLLILGIAFGVACIAAVILFGILICGGSWDTLEVVMGLAGFGAVLLAIFVFIAEVGWVTGKISDDDVKDFGRKIFFMDKFNRTMSTKSDSERFAEILLKEEQLKEREKEIDRREAELNKEPTPKKEPSAVWKYLTTPVGKE